MPSLKDNKGKLAGLVGVGALTLLLTFVPKFEGNILRGYEDPIGIVTACVGHTKTAVLGRPYTKEECETLLIADLAEHAAGVKKCVKVPLTTGQLAASISFAFNVGVKAFCGSTMVKKFNRRDFAGGCAELSRWVLAKGKEFKGLVERRKVERAMCEGTLK